MELIHIVLLSILGVSFLYNLIHFIYYIWEDLYYKIFNYSKIYILLNFICMVIEIICIMCIIDVL